MRGVRLRRRIYGSFIEALDPSGQNKQCSEKRQVYLQSKKSFGGLGLMGTIPCPGRRSAAFLPGNDTGGTSPGTLPSKDSPLGTVFSGKLRAVAYDYYTTLSGVFEKENPLDGEYEVPDKLKDLYLAKDFAPYGKENINVCFITNNDITGGNSGSPVINGDGELVGIAFDGNYEAMSGDLNFEENLQRCISLDIRYVLFIIDKFAQAHNLIQEMKIVA